MVGGRAAWALVVLTGATACDLAPAQAPLPSLGRVQGFTKTAGAGQVALSWHRLGAADGPWWQVDRQVAIGADGRFAFDLTAAPPPEALGSTVDLDGFPMGSEVAIGFLTLVPAGVTLGWTDPDAEVEPPDGLSVHEGHLLLFYLAPPGAAATPVQLGDATVRPGLNLMVARFEDEELVYDFTDVATDIELEDSGQGSPPTLPCRRVVFDTAVPFMEGEEGYPAEFPEHGDVSCRRCGNYYEQYFCEEQLGLVCGGCHAIQVWAPPSPPNQWPCFVEGEACDGEGETTCAFDDQYTCRGGAWVYEGPCPAEACQP